MPAYTPQQAADAALAAIDPTTNVTSDDTTTVAGRAAYELVLTPKDDRSLVGEVRIAIDGEQHIPLRVHAGAIIGAAAAGVPVLLDGLIVGASALLAVALAPAVRPYLIASHRSVEPGHRVVLELLELEPLMDLGLRLGEGSGAAIALHLIRLACKLPTPDGNLRGGRCLRAVGAARPGRDRRAPAILNNR